MVWCRWFLCFALSALVESANGQVQSRDRLIYTPSDYVQYTPQTALDMVLRTPGFVLDEGDANIRGFAAASGNVLIDGARPVSKAGVAVALRRIAASQVAQIEVIRNTNSSESQGQSVVVNVVRKPAEASGTWSAEFERNGLGRIYPRLEASYSRPWQGWETSLRANALFEEFPFLTTRTNRDASGALVSTILTKLPSSLSEAYLSAEAKRATSQGVLSLTARFGRSNYYFDQPGEIFLRRLPSGNPDQRFRTSLDSERWDLELGAEFSREFGSWQWKSTAVLGNRDGAERQSDVVRGSDDRVTSNTEVDASNNASELVLRSAFANPTARWQPEFGIEYSMNRLDSGFALAIDQGGGVVPIALTDVRVEEHRLEPFAKAGRRLASSWVAELELAAEASEISVAGDARQSKTLVFFKPALAFSFRPSNEWRWRAGVRRRVGQLAFDDFAASASLSDGTSAAGNPDLAPDQATRAFASLDYRVADGVALNLEVFHERRNDVLEQIVLSSGSAGLANAGDATLLGAELSLSVPMDALLASSTLKVDGQLRRSRFSDPITRETRALSRVFSPELDAEFRQDLGIRGLSWGVSWSAPNRGDVIRVAEIDRVRSGDAFGAFIETSMIGSIKTTLALRNIGAQQISRARSFFLPDRSGSLLRTEERQQRFPVFVTLTFTGGL